MTQPESATRAGGPTEEPAAEASQFVQYLFFKTDPQWRRLPHEARSRGRREFCEVIAAAGDGITTHAYSTLGLKASAELLLWQRCGGPEPLQELLCAALQSGLGQYLNVSYCLFGLTRPSVYTKRRTLQEQAIDEPTRLKYLVVYPFVKSDSWYLMSRDARQGMMNEHMRIGHDFADVRQLLLYATGLDDQEFVVAYETDDLSRHQQLVMGLRATEGRRYTVRDTPIFTAVHKSLDAALALLG
ncbi:MAG: chlorite dismutase family protein [Gemmatimonadota bacterium]|nr:chlorite dismutase family protein [Gemmatimonadota bacterium]